MAIRSTRTATSPALRSLEYWAYQYKRTWRGSLISSFLSPVLYLAAMGVGLGSLIDKSGNAGHHLGGVAYLPFLAPGLLAASAMQTAANESSYPVLGAIKWIRTYHAMLATPLRVIDVLLGHLAWIALRLLMATTIFLAVMAAFGATKSWSAVLTVPAGVLTGLAFAAPIVAFAATQDNDARFAALFRFVVIPMFLFSGTFFPVSQLPAVMRPIAYASPLWHGVDLCRTLALGTASVGRTIAHSLYLLVWVLGGTAVAHLTYRRRLVN
jgi:lipooligosaccharide transport system permease protein